MKQQAAKSVSAVIVLWTIQAGLYLVIGCFGLFGMAAMMPYGNPQPSAAVVLISYGLKFVALPLVLNLAVLWVAIRCARLEKELLAIAIALAPALLVPKFLMWSLS